MGCELSTIVSSHFCAPGIKLSWSFDCVLEDMMFIVSFGNLTSTDGKGLLGLFHLDFVTRTLYGAPLLYGTLEAGALY